jgi:NAD(P)-dependent dehydrogenase (short-subunit alcohol dehydrogenase family)
MERTVFITGGDRGLGFALCSGFLELGWQVFASQYLPEWSELNTLADRYPHALHIIPLDVSSMEFVRSAAQAVEAITDHLDVLINNAGVISQTIDRTIRETQDYDEMHRLYDVNALGPLRVMESFLPLTDRSKFKRLCFVSSEAGSITSAERTSWYSYCMSKSAFNMGIKILFNHLHPEGYTFRVYHPGWVRSYMFNKKDLKATLEPEEAAAKAIPIFLSQRQDEDRLRLEDYEGIEWPW